MTICPNLKNNICTIASYLAGMECKANEATCTVCNNGNNTQIYKGLAIATLMVSKKQIPDTLRHGVIPVASRYGPGTELKKLISWFIYKRDVEGCQSCYDREIQMNQWGPEGCRSNINIIVDWLRESAAKHSLPFSETLVKILINKAIRNSEKHYEMVRSSNNCS